MIIGRWNGALSFKRIFFLRRLRRKTILEYRIKLSKEREQIASVDRLDRKSVV